MYVLLIVPNIFYILNIFQANQIRYKLNINVYKPIVLSKFLVLNIMIILN
ncbi:hypothetical protein GGR35_001805 [Mucilaginibacter phyllosphaerae]|uniref:Uncharacterized protein n=1 Tax=Mucilaginibacter phyllosphaerae TaxID=1812349 RepID=A0ABR6I8B2_9SPHI|nr:hypothetical protein [Mucilaginibacter phyllosphaerae]